MTLTLVRPALDEKTTAFAQLTIDGGEVPLADIATRARPGASMKLVLEYLRLKGSVRSAMAGRLIHDARRQVCERPTLPGAIGCCKWAGSDGGEVLRRLEARGLVEQIGGVWYPSKASGPADSVEGWTSVSSAVGSPTASSQPSS